MKTFPKFLRILPNFYGLSFYDIGVLLVVIYVATFLKLNPIFTILSALGGIFFAKFVQRHFDFVGWMVPKRVTMRRKL